MTNQPQANAGRVYTDLAPLSYLTAAQNLYRNTEEYQEMLSRGDFDNLVKAQYNRIRPAPAIRGNYFAMKGALMRRTRTALCEDKVAVDLARNPRAYDDSFSDRVIKATMALLRYNGRLQRSREQSKRRQTKTESRTCQYKLTALLSADKLNAPNLKDLYTGIPMIRNMTEEREFHHYVRNMLAEQRRLSRAFAEGLAGVEIKEILTEA